MPRTGSSDAAQNVAMTMRVSIPDAQIVQRMRAAQQVLNRQNRSWEDAISVYRSDRVNIGPMQRWWYMRDGSTITWADEVVPDHDIRIESIEQLYRYCEGQRDGHTVRSPQFVTDPDMWGGQVRILVECAFADVVRATLGKNIDPVYICQRIADGEWSRRSIAEFNTEIVDTARERAHAIFMEHIRHINVGRWKPCRRIRSGLRHSLSCFTLRPPYRRARRSVSFTPFLRLGTESLMRE